MLRGSLMLLSVVVAAAGCPGGDAGIGATCGGNDDCAGSLQCLNNRCVARCERAPDCGDGYACQDDGSCTLATRGPGDTCSSEVDCAAGLACQLEAVADANLRLSGSCQPENEAHPAGAACDSNADCRNTTCALGHCVDLCQQDRDCGDGTTCAVIPSVDVSNALFSGCLPDHGSLSWRIPVTSTSPEILIPAPMSATSLELVMSVDDTTQQVGATSVLAPNGTRIYTRPCSSITGACLPAQETDQYFNNAQRHAPGFGASVLAIPSGTKLGIMTGVYQIDVASQHADDTAGSSIPRVTAVVRLDTGVRLELHFFFLDLSDHPCQAGIGLPVLDAAAAVASPIFQHTYLDEIRKVFGRAALGITPATYENITNHPSLDGLDVANVGDLLELGKYATGINVFFVRSLSPAGVHAYAPNPGPAGVAGSRQSGIVIGLDMMCYRDWKAVARLTSHELARYMGLYHNIELGTPSHETWRDQISDDGKDPDPAANLMFFAEQLGANPPELVISDGQRSILTRSAALVRP